MGGGGTFKSNRPLLILTVTLTTSVTRQYAVLRARGTTTGGRFFTKRNRIPGARDTVPTRSRYTLTPGTIRNNCASDVPRAYIVTRAEPQQTGGVLGVYTVQTSTKFADVFVDPPSGVRVEDGALNSFS